MTDIVERLHEYDLACQMGSPTVEILCDELTEAVTEIETLRAELQRMSQRANHREKGIIERLRADIEWVRKDFT